MLENREPVTSDERSILMPVQESPYQYHSGANLRPPKQMSVIYTARSALLRLNYCKRDMYASSDFSSDIFLADGRIRERTLIFSTLMETRQISRSHSRGMQYGYGLSSRYSGGRDSNRPSLISEFLTRSDHFRRCQMHLPRQIYPHQAPSLRQIILSF